MANVIEELADRYDVILCNANETVLQQVARDLNFESSDTEGKGRRHLRKIITLYYEEIMNDDDLTDKDKTTKTAPPYCQYERDASAYG